jgi:hypothetical protein
VVKRLPTSTTNITGFLIIRRGSSFLKESTTAEETMARSKSGRAVALMGQFLPRRRPSPPRLPMHPMQALPR